MKQQLTLENISPYLPYGLYSKRGEKLQKLEWDLTKQHDIYIAFTMSDVLNQTWKPLLRQMDLTKPIIVEGKEVIPIVELALIVHGFGRSEWKNRLKSMNVKDITHSNIESSVTYNNVGEGRRKLSYNKGWKSFLLSDYNSSVYALHIPDSNALFKWLYAHFFDVEDLIGKNLAINVNSLDINPYE